MKKRSEDRRFSDKEFLDQTGDFQSSTIKLPPGVKQFKLKDTNTRKIDIIPYTIQESKWPYNPTWAHEYARPGTPGRQDSKRSFFTHRIQAGGRTRMFICLRQTFGQKCPICEEGSRLLNDDPDSEMGKSLVKASHRHLWRVIDLDNRDAGIQVWDISHHYFGRQLQNAIDSGDGDEFRYYADPKEGYSLRLGVEEQQYGKNDLKVVRVDFKPRTKQYNYSIYEEGPCLTNLLKVLDYDELKEVFLEAPSSEDNDNGATKKGSDMKRKMTAKKLGISKGDTVVHEDLGSCCVTAISKDGFTLTVIDEEEDEHQVGVLEVTKEEKKAKKAPAKATKAPAKGKKKADDDEDEDDDDDEDEDDDDDEEEDEDDDDDDDEDEDDDDDDDEDEDDDDDDDEDDDEDDDDDEDEPAPKKKRKK